MVTALLAGVLAVLLAQQTDTTFAVPARGRIEIENHRGAVLVRSWNRSAVQIRATHASDIETEIHHSGSVVRVETGGRHGHGEVEYEITVPRAFAVAIEGVFTDAVLENIGGEVDVETVQGNITLGGGRDRIDLESVQGEIIVSGARGRIRAETSDRGIRMRDIAGEVNAETVSGPIILEDVDATELDASTVSGRVEYNGTVRPGGRYSLSSHNGDILFTVPRGIDATFSVATHGGAVQADFPVRVKGEMSRGEMSFTLGDGSARIELESFNGSIRLRRPRTSN